MLHTLCESLKFNVKLCIFHCALKLGRKGGGGGERRGGDDGEEKGGEEETKGKKREREKRGVEGKGSGRDTRAYL